VDAVLATDKIYNIQVTLPIGHVLSFKVL
jgi:hypothetical protein